MKSFTPPVKAVQNRANGAIQCRNQHLKALVNNRPQAAIQLKLQEGINARYRPLTPIIQRKLVIGSGTNREVYTSMPDSPVSGDAVFPLKEAIKGYTGEVGAVYEYLKKWSDRPKTSTFKTREEAILKAIEKVKYTQCGQTIHFSSAPMSPYTSFQQDLIDHLNGPGRDAEHMKDGKDWNELKINGQLGEYSHQNLLDNDGINFADANDYFGYNAPGIDTFCDEEGYLFGQSKMHMADGSTVENVADEYLKHVDAAPNYAKTFLKCVLVEGEQAEAKRDLIRELAGKWDNETLNEFVDHLDDEDNIVSKGDLNDLLDSSVADDGSLIHHPAVSHVSNAMHFPVPRDVYKQIKATHPSKKRRFTKLPGNLYDYRKAKAGMRFRPNKRRKTEEEKDGNFIG